MTEQTEHTEETTVTPERAAPGAPETTSTATSRTTTTRPGGNELGRRMIILAFGLVQLVIVLRVVLLLLDAREGNAIVSGILDISQFFVAPFDGILKTNALQSGGSILDLAAIVALVGWSILELVALWALGIFRGEPTPANANR